MTDISKLIEHGKAAPPNKFIVMGEPMSGKTTLASKAPRPLFVSTDGNAKKAGLDAVNVDGLATVRATVEFFVESDKYDTLVIDTIEGIADLFEKAIIEAHNKETGSEITALSDVSFGRLTGQFNKRLAAFSETLWSLPKNVIVLSYTKRKTDDISGAIVLDSELKSIRQFTRFADGLILTSYDGEKYQAGVVAKRTVMAGDIEYGAIEPFLIAAGWKLPTRKTKLGIGQKNK